MDNFKQLSKRFDLCCPLCKNKILQIQKKLQCTNVECPHNKADAYFSLIDEKPILISNFSDTIFRSEAINSQITRIKGSLIKQKLNNFIFGRPVVTEKNCVNFLTQLKKNNLSPRCLIIGSGEKGRGTERLFEDRNVSILGTDVYESEFVEVISDAHYLPFENESFDGIWIQAVLEHVVNPQSVVDEIYRVLKPHGVVYAETPFMQQVHEGCYDFNRFTVLGHRYLFKRFKLIEIGGNKGVGTVATWSIKYLFWSIFRSKKIATILSIPFAIIFRLIEKLADKRSLFDASSGVYFLGTKSSESISHRDLIELYKGMQ